MAIKPPTLLVVDDLPANLDLLLNVLRQEQYRVLVAENGSLALERARYVQPDLILLDVLMPDLDGYVVCQQLKADDKTRDIPVIFLTALTETIDKVRGFEVGGVDYVTKPIQVSEVLARIQTHLTLRRLQQELQQNNQHLEERVQQRTAELNAELLLRRRNEEEKNQLLTVVSSQFDQLRQLTGWVIERQQQHHTAVANNLHQHFAQGLHLLASHLALIDTLWRQQLAKSPLEKPQSERDQSIGDDQTEKINQAVITSQIEQACAIIAQLKEGLQITTNEITQPTPETKAALANPLLNLSAREIEVLQLIVAGKNSNEIAQLLYLADVTVRTYRSRLMQKLELDNLSDLIKFAIKHKLTSIDPLPRSE